MILWATLLALVTVLVAPLLAGLIAVTHHASRWLVVCCALGAMAIAVPLSAYVHSLARRALQRVQRSLRGMFFLAICMLTPMVGAAATLCLIAALAELLLSAS